jgi:hypothetical protein
MFLEGCRYKELLEVNLPSSIGVGNDASDTREVHVLEAVPYPESKLFSCLVSGYRGGIPTPGPQPSLPGIYVADVRLSLCCDG